MPQALLTSVILFAAIALFAGAAHAQALEPLRGDSSDVKCDTSVAVLPPPGLAPPSVVNFFLWGDMTKIWTFQRANQQKLIKDRLASMQLRDIDVTLPPVPFGFTPRGACSFTAIPQTKLLRLKFQARGNSMSSVRRNVFGPALKVSGTFDLDVVMFFGTNGPPGRPVVLQRAEMTVEDFRFTGTNRPAARNIAATFAKQTFSDAGFGTLVAIDINNFIRTQVGRQAMDSVTPGARGAGDAIRLFFDVRVVRPALGPNAVQ
jgi:hypothetical protein